MKKRLRVLVLFDLRTPPPKDFDFGEELKTEEKQTEADVIAALDRLGHRVRILGVYDDPGMIVDEIKANPPDVVFNLAEEFNSRSAFERNVVALLQMLGVRYTGTGPTGLTLCKNKGMAKEILAYHRIDSPAFAIFPPGSAIRRPKRLHFPLFVKPLKNEASYGISQGSFVKDDPAFEERIRFIHESMKQEAMAEEYIEGREFYVSLIGNRRLEVLPIREILFTKMPDDRPHFSTFKAKWDEAYRQRWGIQNTFAENLPEGAAERITKACKKVYHALHIQGYGRIDLRLTPDQRIMILEANPNPCLASDDEFAQSAMKAGMAYDPLIQRILRLALQD